ncbi:HNH endonuclease [Corynebacterium sp. YIM 101645]|uniref:HNH endonuclease n=1 Tax=Corynebacterium lemuris TaxID=1859292 RepID=A0ABT2FYT7_9CORY|nr:HNH endonuclease signature motif containing protein [Corynebacterium lemuris]MCS5480396.1 HNH endonuclease [Corynebacterium lemuris]
MTAPTAITTLIEQSDAELTTTITDAHRQLTRHKARFIIALTEFNDRELADAHGAPNTAAWLQRTHSIARRTAYEYLRTGRGLRKFPRLAQEFLAATFSYSVVRLLLRHMTPDNEEELIGLARAHPITELAQLLAGRDQPDSRPTANRISVVTDPETGEVRIWGRLDPERGAEFLAALKISELAHLIDIDEVAEDELADPAAVEKLVEQARTPEEEKPRKTRFGAPLSTTLFTAFMGLVHMVRSHPLSRVRAPGAEVNVLYTQDHRAFLPGHHGGQTGELMRSVLNGSVRWHLLSREGLALKVSRSTRLASRAQEKALLTAWGHQCAAPGCDHTRFLEFHHIVPWAEGGVTELANLLPLCSGCHGLIAAGTMTVHIDADPDLIRFRFPDGECFTSERRRPAVTDEAMGRWGDRYFDGPVPDGDEHLLQVWDHPDSFDEPREGKV